MTWISIVERCPRCATPRTGAGSPFRCLACGLTLFANPAVGVGAFIVDPRGRVLFTVRGRDPGKGMLGLPGGFVDAGESAEDALRREAREEIGGVLQDIRYLCSSPNSYLFAGVAYDVLDVFFSAELAPGALTTDADEIAGLRWLLPAEVREVDIAFPSMRAAWRAYAARF
jgi:ADP-ribose pyrophosphatase YjhB (NUDIX family)